MSKFKKFKNIEEGDTVEVMTEDISKNTYDVYFIEGEGKDKIVLFDEFISDTKLVIKHNKLYLERRAKAHPRGWSTYVKVDNIDII